MLSRILTALAAVVMLSVAASPAQARWIKAESPRFIVYSNGSESVLRDYVTRMELFDTFLRARHGLPETGVPSRKLPIYLVRTRDDLQETWHGAGDAIAGYYLPGASNVFAVATSEGRGDDSTILHEYVHHFMLGSFPGAYPSWMVEGYAEYYGVTRISDRFIEVGQVNDMRGEELLSGKWMPMANLLGNKRSSTDWGSFYAQSWLLTHYLMSDPERYKQFQAYAAAVAKGGDPVKSMTDVTGLSMEALEQTLRRYARSGLKITQFNRGGFAPPLITITTLPPSADDLLLPRVQIVSQYYKEAPPGFLGMIQRRAAKYPGDQLATLTLGQTEAELGDDLKARKLLGDWIAAHPDDAEAMYVLGVALYDDAFERDPEEDVKKDDPAKKDDKARKEEDEATAEPKIRKVADKALMAEAESWLKKASVLAPNDYRILYAYAQARRFSGSYPSAADQDYLIRAYKQAPQVVGLRFELIQVLMANRHWREARALLAPLVNNPHGGQTAAAAKGLLQRIEEAEKAGR